MAEKAEVERQLMEELRSAFPKERICTYQTHNMKWPKAGIIKDVSLSHGYPVVTVQPYDDLTKRARRLPAEHVRPI
jgi:hypothetical protein